MRGRPALIVGLLAVAGWIAACQPTAPTVDPYTEITEELKRLLDAAVEFARSQGATAVEGYPIEPRSDHMPEIYAWMGLASMFEKSGFEEIARRSETRPLMRKVL